MVGTESWAILLPVPVKQRRGGDRCSQPRFSGEGEQYKANSIGHFCSVDTACTTHLSSCTRRTIRFGNCAGRLDLVGFAAIAGLGTGGLFVAGIDKEMFSTLALLTAMSLIALFLLGRKWAARDSEHADKDMGGRRRPLVIVAEPGGLDTLHPGAGAQETCPPSHDLAADLTDPAHSAVASVDPAADCDHGACAVDAAPPVFEEGGLEAFEQELEAAFESYAAGTGSLQDIERVVDRFDPHGAALPKRSMAATDPATAKHSPPGLAEAVEWTRLWLAERRLKELSDNGG